MAELKQLPAVTESFPREEHLPVSMISDGRLSISGSPMPMVPPPSLRTSSESYHSPKTRAKMAMMEKKKWSEKKLVTKTHKKIARQLSSNVVDAGVDRSISEAEIDELILKLINPREGLAIQTYQKMFKTFENAFSGAALIDAIQKYFDTDRDTAHSYGQTLLMNRGVFYSLHRSKRTLYDRKKVYYRFKCMEHPCKLKSLNEWKLYFEEVHYPVAVSQDLLMSAIHLLMIPHHKDDFSKIRETAQFYRFWLETAKLQMVLISSMSPEEQLVFFINVHNSLMVHAYILYGMPVSKNEIKAMLHHSYRIGQYHYSLQTIRAALSGKLPSGKAYEDIKLEPNALATFCLFYGSDQSPALRCYSVENLQEMMELQTKDYLDKHLILREDFNQVWLPRMLGEHVNEFGASEREMMHNLCQYAPNHKRSFLLDNIATIEIKYKDTTFDNVRFL